MKFTGIEIFHLRIPFKRAYRHSLAEHRASDTIVTRIETDKGTVGWGETIPREYLTGETAASVVATIRDDFWPIIKDREFGDFADLRPALEELCALAHERRLTAAYCALELAALDAAGRHFAKPAAAILGPGVFDRILYTAPIDNLSIKKATRRAFIFRLLGFKHYKVKVGHEGDEELARTVRRGVRAVSDVRVDANCAWDAETAVRKIERLAKYGISSVEQPTPRGDTAAMAAVARRCGVPIMADESLCTISDAKRLIEQKACAIFNVRLAKCGGLLGAKMMVDIAKQNGVRWQMGCLVGETGILAAAERGFLSRVSGWTHAEYPFTRQLLGDFITDAPGAALPRGTAQFSRLPNSGGVNIIENNVRKFCVK